MAGNAKSNIVKSVHESAQLEGLHCTLVGGIEIEKGRHFDMFQEKTLKCSPDLLYSLLTSTCSKALKDAGVHPSYQSGHLSKNVIKNLKHKSEFVNYTHHPGMLGLNSHNSPDTFYHSLMAEDGKIEKHNQKMQKSHEALQKAQEKLEAFAHVNTSPVQMQKCFKKARLAEKKASASSLHLIKWRNMDRHLLTWD
jgi:hypothetical protein